MTDPKRAGAEPAVCARCGRCNRVVDASPALARLLGAASIPTLLVLHRGREVARRVGAVPPAELLAWAEATVIRLATVQRR
jgi:thioredoxin-like negative regulator of GroEL